VPRIISTVRNGTIKSPPRNRRRTVDDCSSVLSSGRGGLRDEMRYSLGRDRHPCLFHKLVQSISCSNVLSCGLSIFSVASQFSAGPCLSHPYRRRYSPFPSLKRYHYYVSNGLTIDDVSSSREEWKQPEPMELRPASSESAGVLRKLERAALPSARWMALSSKWTGLSSETDL
jgi:hypothetical protein